MESYKYLAKLELDLEDIDLNALHSFMGDGTKSNKSKYYKDEYDVLLSKNLVVFKSKQTSSLTTSGQMIKKALSDIKENKILGKTFGGLNIKASKAYTEDVRFIDVFRNFNKEMFMDMTHVFGDLTNDLYRTEHFVLINNIAFSIEISVSYTEFFIKIYSPFIDGCLNDILCEEVYKELGTIIERLDSLLFTTSGV